MKPDNPQPDRTIPSPDGRFRAEITRRPAGGFQVTVYRWTEEHVPGYGKVAEFWERVHGHLTVTDTLENAETLAEEALRAAEYT